MPPSIEMAASRTKFAVVDLFAGPGGLAEGFSSVTDRDGVRPFQIALSVEKEKAAHSTLLLRAFLRQFEGHMPSEYYDFLRKGTGEPNWAELYPEQWKTAKRDTLLLELGLPETDAILRARVEEIRRRHGGNTLLIGGPPCQAYSIVGRARNRGIAGYVAEDDPKHFLYESYIDILSRLRPAAFVMENVKGMLSSSLSSGPIFRRILDDLSNAGEGYVLLALCPQNRQQPELISSEPHPSDFILRGEEFGLPQARHRVIVVGVRKSDFDGAAVLAAAPLLTPSPLRTKVEDVLEGMPRLRSGLSRQDSFEMWGRTMKEAASLVCKAVGFLPIRERAEFRDRVNECAGLAADPRRPLPRIASRPARLGARCPRSLRKWLLDSRLDALPNNETREHMPADPVRYLFAAVYAEMMGISPKAKEFPESLAPDHRNWTSGKFNDRFRVQVSGLPSNTITSHISKDGHYFIHYDPEQCRSLTVREAARLQTFPDNYLFKGYRTEQFIQVGNAVPPFLAKQIGDAIYALLMSASRQKGRAS
jgi:DNA (cytosine-5)-methyltransferase 1